MKPPLRAAALLVVLMVCAAFVAATTTSAKTLTTAGAKCAAAKLKATAKKTAAQFKCYMKAGPGVAADPACLTAAEQAFTAAFSKAENGGGCATNGDAAAVESTVDTFVAAVVEALPPAPLPTPAPSDSTRCCDKGGAGGQQFCFDSTPETVDARCQATIFGSVTVEPSGTFCDATVPQCGPTKRAARCCDGPFGCFEYADPSEDAVCTETVVGGQVRLGTSGCGPVSRTCGGQ